MENQKVILRTVLNEPQNVFELPALASNQAEFIRKEEHRDMAGEANRIRSRAPRQHEGRIGQTDTLVHRVTVPRCRARL